MRILTGAFPASRTASDDGSDSLTTFLTFSSDGVQVGHSTDKLGFFGATPIVQPTIKLTNPAVQDIIDVLVNLGVCLQADP